MSYKILEQKSGEVKFEIEVGQEQLKKITDLVAAELSKNMNISGFRPGKAPLFIVQKEVGDDRFWAEVIDRIVPEAFYEAVASEKLMTISQPQIKIQKFVPGESLVFEAQVAILPEIKDLKYKDLKIKVKEEKVTEKEKEEALQNVLKRTGEEKEVNRAAKDGDKVEIDFTGTLKGLPFEGNESKNHPIVLGSGMMIPGFEEKFVGKKPGEEFDFDITFPKEYHANNLAGEKVNFKVKLNRILETELPKADDDWAQKMGFKNLADLKDAISKELEFEKELTNRRAAEEEMLNKIIEQNKIEAPGALVAEETHRMVHEAEHNLASSGLTIEKFLEMSNKTLPELEKEFQPEAEKRVKIGLVLGEISKLEKITVSDEEVDAEVEKIIAGAPAEVSREDLKAAYEEPNRKRELHNNLIVRKTLEKLWELNVK